jgi:hypothetical protein
LTRQWLCAVSATGMNGSGSWRSQSPPRSDLPQWLSGIPRLRRGAMTALPCTLLDWLPDQDDLAVSDGIVRLERYLAWLLGVS